MSQNFLGQFSIGLRAEHVATAVFRIPCARRCLSISSGFNIIDRTKNYPLKYKYIPFPVYRFAVGLQLGGAF